MWVGYRGPLSTICSNEEILIRGLVRIHEYINLNHCQNTFSKNCYIVPDIIITTNPPERKTNYNSITPLNIDYLNLNKH